MLKAVPAHLLFIFNIIHKLNVFNLLSDIYFIIVAVNQATKKLLYQSINPHHSIIVRVNQATNQLLYQSIKPPTNYCTSQSVHQSILCQAIIPPIYQPTIIEPDNKSCKNQSCHQPIIVQGNHSTNQLLINRSIMSQRNCLWIWCGFISLNPGHASYQSINNIFAIYLMDHRQKNKYKQNSPLTQQSIISFFLLKLFLFVSSLLMQG